MSQSETSRFSKFFAIFQDNSQDSKIIGKQRIHPLRPQQDPSTRPVYLYKGQNADEVVTAALKGANWTNVYFTPALLSMDAFRARNNDVLGTWVLWADIDAGHHRNADLIEEGRVAWERLEPRLRRLRCFPTAVVNSGHGFHCYWRLNQFIPGRDVRVLLERLNEQLAAAGIYADSHCTNPARLLRVPYTFNAKGDDIVPCSVQHLASDLSAATYRVEDVVGGPYVESPATAQPLALEDYARLDGYDDHRAALPADTLVKECGVLAAAVATGGEHHWEPLWFAMMGLVHAADKEEDRISLAKRVSCRHPGYVEEETLRKFRRARYIPKCETLEKEWRHNRVPLGPCPCDTCPLKTYGTNPASAIHLKLVGRAPDAVLLSDAPDPDGLLVQSAPVEPKMRYEELGFSVVPVRDAETSSINSYLHVEKKSKKGSDKPDSSSLSFLASDYLKSISVTYVPRPNWEDDVDKDPLEEALVLDFTNIGTKTIRLVDQSGMEELERLICVPEPCRQKWRTWMTRNKSRAMNAVYGSEEFSMRAKIANAMYRSQGWIDTPNGLTSSTCKQVLAIDHSLYTANGIVTTKGVGVGNAKAEHFRGDLQQHVRQLRQVIDLVGPTFQLLLAAAFGTQASRLIDRNTSNPAALLVYGPGGIGKTLICHVINGLFRPSSDTHSQMTDASLFRILAEHNGLAVAFDELSESLVSGSSRHWGGRHPLAVHLKQAVNGNSGVRASLSNQRKIVELGELRHQIIGTSNHPILASHIIDQDRTIADRFLQIEVPKDEVAASKKRLSAYTAANGASLTEAHGYFGLELARFLVREQDRYRSMSAKNLFTEHLPQLTEYLYDTASRFHRMLALGIITGLELSELVLGKAMDRKGVLARFTDAVNEHMTHMAPERRLRRLCLLLNGIVSAARLESFQDYLAPDGTPAPRTVPINPHRTAAYQCYQNTGQGLVPVEYRYDVTALCIARDYPTLLTELKALPGVTISTSTVLVPDTKIGIDHEILIVRPSGEDDAVSV